MQKYKFVLVFDNPDSYMDNGIIFDNEAEAECFYSTEKNISDRGHLQFNENKTKFSLSINGQERDLTGICFYAPIIE